MGRDDRIRSRRRLSVCLSSYICLSTLVPIRPSSFVLFVSRPLPSSSCAPSDSSKHLLKMEDKKSSQDYSVESGPDHPSSPDAHAARLGEGDAVFGDEVGHTIKYRRLSWPAVCALMICEIVSVGRISLELYGLAS